MNKSLLAATLTMGLQAGGALAADTDFSAPYDWSGFYAGGHIGQSWAEGRFFVDTVGSFGFEADTLRFGVFAGYNHVTDGILLGIEADISFGEADDAFSVIDDFDIEPEATLRLRLGLPEERILPYVTLGVALADADASDVNFGNASELHLGLAAGVGLEFALTHAITLRGEYLFESFGKTTYEIASFNDTAEWDEHVLRAGVTYKFNR
ncbi:MAG: outer membrane protein [Hyphomicrobiales bacterium]